MIPLKNYNSYLIKKHYKSPTFMDNIETLSAKNAFYLEEIEFEVKQVTKWITNLDIGWYQA